jgi:small basic protein
MKQQKYIGKFATMGENILVCESVVYCTLQLGVATEFKFVFVETAKINHSFTAYLLKIFSLKH